MRFLMLFFIFVAQYGFASEPSVSKGRLERLADFSSKFVPARHVDVWLPPGYLKSKRYPVLYMHDGQMLFDATKTWNHQEWQVDEVASALIESQAVVPFIVVGVWNGGENRHSEYFPQKPFEALSEAQQAAEYQKRRSADQRLFATRVYSDDYLAFLVRELKPYIDSHYATDAEESYLMGSSMGGLISWYGMLEYPDVFKGAACLSTHWPGSFSEQNNPAPDAFIAYINQNIARLSGHKLYFDHGTVTLDAMYPPLQSQVDNLLKRRGYPESSWLSLQFEGADHSEKAWAARLDVPLRFLFAKPQPD
ncbi:alpha/beta hydrolase [Alteromonas aestuariivivens]|uniref:Alpha/beta hydrolase n=1 Tax=Alteromonas aestuariivivens TaxID=1938339 RepID=A0A3D8M6H0_9ALTE|nr:alpha/beta hydrolase-fold protein [Alteromonas aestuariivivens]RDV25170.1 alpha/beta hydrolase [Alteromonas aestuariivivens]